MSLLVLTVGTGTSTAGRHSDVAQGLANTLIQIRPRGFWLVPSSSADSTCVADLIRESLPGEIGTNFRYWDSDAGLAYRKIADPDSLEDCRASVREVIRAVRPLLEEGESLVINPTSGTKQMSAGATLAALDEEIGDIQFTVGERKDGVVMTGSERIVSFDAGRFFEERDLAAADRLFASGAFHAAARLLLPHRSAAAAAARHKALCLHEWQRLNRAEAAKLAARFDPDLARKLESLSAADPVSLEVLREVFAGADALHAWGDADEAAARYYRGAELAARVILASGYGLWPMSRGGDRYHIGEVERVIGPKFPDLAEAKRMGREWIHLDRDTAWRALNALGHPAAKAYLDDGELQRLLRKRNAGLYGHGLEAVDPAEVGLLRERLRTLFDAHYPAICWSLAGRPATLR